VRLTDLTGQRFTRLVVVSRAQSDPSGAVKWHCLCDCGATKDVQAANLRSGSTVSCGCYGRERVKEANTKPPMSIRFWDSVAIGSDDQCWEWQGRFTRQGYGQIRVGSRQMHAHRVAWSLHNGREPERLILHHCDNPACVNPAHLYEGTPLDNMRDKVLAGRWRNNMTGPMTPEEELATRGIRQSFN
jgi:hypothetical protein